MQSEKLQGVFTAAEFFQKMGVTPGAEETLDNVDFDEMARNVLKYSGCPEEIQRVQTEVKKIRQGRAEAQMEQAKMEQIRQASEVARNAGGAMQSMGMGAGGQGGGGK
jgi:hypothetical protein